MRMLNILLFIFLLLGCSDKATEQDKYSSIQLGDRIETVRKKLGNEIISIVLTNGMSTYDFLWEENAQRPIPFQVRTNGVTLIVNTNGIIIRKFPITSMAVN